MKQKFYFRYLLIFVFLFLLTTNSEAVPYPRMIQWRASPRTFIISLYRGVLNRQPENQAVVNAWARNITNNKSSRLKVFWQFVTSKEYQRSRWAKLRKEYSVYYKSVGEYKRYKRYYITKESTVGFYVAGKYSFGVAMAVRDYCATFDGNSEERQWNRNSRNRRNSNSVNLLGITPD